MLRSRNRILSDGLCWLVWFAFTPAVAFGQTFWDGGASGVGTAWTTAANWAGDVLPAAGANITFDNVNVAGALPTAMSVSADSTFGLITFDNGKGKLPASLVIVTNGTGGTTARTLTINTGITLANSNTTVTFNAGSNGTLAFALGGNVAFMASPGGTIAINPVISGSGRLSILGGGTVVLNGTNLFTGGVTVGGGAAQPTSTLVLNNVNGLGAVPGSTFDTSLVLDGGYVRAGAAMSLPATRGITITPNGASLGAFPGTNLTILGTIKETGGPSRLTIGNANSGTGQVILGASSNVAGGFSDGITVQNGATLNILASTALGVLPTLYDPDNVLLNNGTLRSNSGSTGVVLAAVRGVTVTPLGATFFSPSQTASLTVSSPILESGGPSRITITGGGLVNLSGTSNGAGGYSGGIAATMPGTVLSIGTTLALGVAPASFVPDHIVLNSGTTFAYSNSGGTIGATRGLQIGPNVGSGTATINLTGPAGSTLRIDGVIADQPGGSGGLNVSGTGNVLTVSAANTYSGGTTLTGATLQVNSPATAGVSGTGTGSVTVNTGGTLAGTGFIIPGTLNVVAVAAGGTLAPGNPGVPGVSAGSGTLTIFGPTNIAPTAILKVGITGSNPSANGTPGSSSLGTAPAFSTNTFLNLTGTLLLDPSMKLMIDGTGWSATPGQTYSFTVAQATGVTGILPGYANRLALDAQASTTGFAATPSDLVLFVGDGTLGDANTLYVNVTAAVPEPGAILFVSVACLAGLRVVRRRK